MSSNKLPHMSDEFDNADTTGNVHMEQALSRIFSTNLRPEVQVSLPSSEPDTESTDVQLTTNLCEGESQNVSSDGRDLELSKLTGASPGNESTYSGPALMEDHRKYCWVCFATDEDDATASWVKPCHCRGTTKWVHQSCIQRWVDEKQKNRGNPHVSCPQCNTKYIIVYPDMGSLVVLLDTIDRTIFRICPVLSAGIVAGSIYWTAVTYGAVTVMQVVGYKDGLTLMEEADPSILLVGLPTIPIILVLGKMLRWEDQALKFLRRYGCKLPILKHFLPSSHSDENRLQSYELFPIRDPMSSTRVLCGALLLPTIASICGKILFEGIKSNFQKTLLGGIAFIAIKGAFKMYHKQQQYVRQCQRRIMDYTDVNIEKYKNTRTSGYRADHNEAS